MKNAKELMQDLVDGFRRREKDCKRIADSTESASENERLIAKASAYGHAADLAAEAMMRLSFEEYKASIDYKDLGAKAYQQMCTTPGGHYAPCPAPAPSKEREEWEAGWAHERDGTLAAATGIPSKYLKTPPPGNPIDAMLIEVVVSSLQRSAEQIGGEFGAKLREATERYATERMVPVSLLQNPPVTEESYFTDPIMGPVMDLHRQVSMGAVAVPLGECSLCGPADSEVMVETGRIEFVRMDPLKTAAKCGLSEEEVKAVQEELDKLYAESLRKP
jgi:hypothetical protein